MLEIVSLLAIIALAYLTGWLFPNRLQLTDERVRRNFLRCYPDQQIADIFIDDEGRTALLRLQNEQSVGLVLQPSDRIVCRMLTIPVQFDISPTDGALIIKVHDYVVPDVRFSTGNIAQDKLEEILRPDHDNKGGQYAT